MRIAVLPLDERPVNTKLPAMVAAVAGADTVLPTAEQLPWMRKAGDADALADWLSSVADSVDAMVVSLDMLGYGGLIPSRTSSDRLETVLGRIGVLRRIRDTHPRLPMSGVTTVLRASDSNNAGEEPAYWSEYGKVLHRLGGALHRRFLTESPPAGSTEATEANDPDIAKAAVPASVRQDYLQRRLRNHTADLYAIELAVSGVLRPMVVTADDTAERSAGSLEQHWLSAWIDALDLGVDQRDSADGPGSTTGADDRAAVLCYPGADEVGAVLTAEALAARLTRRPRIAAVFSDEDGAERVAPYENIPIGRGVRSQILAVGATPVSDPGQADAVLLVHPPSEQGGGERGADGRTDPVVGALDLVQRQDPSAIVGLADVAWPNGSDVALVEGLLERDLVQRLAAYGGWNTAGNTIGSVVAALVATVAGRELGTYDANAARRLLLHRLVEDYGYQAVVRPRVGARREFADHLSSPFDEPDDLVSYLAECVPRLEGVLAEFDREWRLGDVQLPWNRMFEIDFELTSP